MKIFIISLIIVLLSGKDYISPQSTYLGYTFLQSTWDNFNEITGGAISTAGGNDGAENIILPFPIKYFGITYSTARISVNGWMEMGQSYTGPGSDNQLQSTLMKPLICPLWDDLYADSQSEISYKVTGEYPARFFTIQWKNITWAGNSNRKTFQIRLWEIDNTIDLIYGPGNMVSTNSSYSIGFNNHAGGADNFISLTPVQLYDPQVSTTNASNNNYDLLLIPENMMYSFMPETDLFFGNAFVYQVPGSILPGTLNQPILAVIIPTHAGDILTAPWTTGFNFNTYGTTNTQDIDAAKTFYTGNSPYFSTTYLLGNYPSPNGQFIIPGGTSQLNNDLTYYWLAYDISPEAELGNIVDGQCTMVARVCCPSIHPDTSLSTNSLLIIPVELAGFEACQYGRSVELKWTTKTELNNSGFYIQRKNENHYWQTLGFINGAGTTSEPQLYSYTDKLINDGFYYYRLKQVDLDGFFNFFGVLEINVTGVSSYSLEQNYPNPFNPVTSIDYAIRDRSLVTLSVYDILGNVAVVLVNEIKEAGHHRILFDASEFSSGVYLYKLSAGHFNQTRKMILMK